MFGQDRENIGAFLEYLEGVVDTHHLGKPILSTFDDKAYRKLAIGGPTRPTMSIPFHEAITDLKIICEDFINGSRVDELGLSPTNDAVRAFLLWFLSRDPPPGPLPRAKLQAQLFSQGRVFGPENYMQRMCQEMQDLESPEMLATDAVALTKQLESLPGSDEGMFAGGIDDFMKKAYPVCDVDDGTLMCVLTTREVTHRFNQSTVPEFLPYKALFDELM